MTRPLVALILLTLAAPARAAEEIPVSPCAQPQVLLLVAEHVQRAGRLTQIEPGSIGERPGGTPGTVRCALRIHTIIYDTAGAGYRPLDEVTTFQFTLELRKNAIFLSAAR